MYRRNRLSRLGRLLPMRTSQMNRGRRGGGMLFTLVSVVISNVVVSLLRNQSSNIIQRLFQKGSGTQQQSMGRSGDPLQTATAEFSEELATGKTKQKEK
ncbi:hypothetical protein [Thalassobacillus hwangdonensis]|uniref:Uncharacterized protein n=1 Tax=Thalassobacillus hwangdonensis TaxID=546108 RepID=A0ABW3L2X4_9BACI